MANYSLIGYPLSHSFSRKYFLDKFKYQNINHDYLNLEIKELSELKSKIIEHNIVGFNVTIPHKINILNHLDEIDIVAKKIGAVNCVKIVNGKWKGFNTDVIGFEKSLLPLLKQKQSKALILGTGGASLAVAFVLKKLGIEFKYVSRDSERGMSYNSLKGKLNNYSIIINTTPLGMSPNVKNSPLLPFDEIGEKHLCFDLIYNPEKTIFLEKSEYNGAIIKNGQEMLEIQAEESWQTWNN